MARLTIDTERLFPSGALVLSTRIHGELIKQQYMGYTARQAEKMFREHCNSLKEQNQAAREKATLRHGLLKGFRIAYSPIVHP